MTSRSLIKAYANLFKSVEHISKYNTQSININKYKIKNDISEKKLIKNFNELVKYIKNNI
jgi:hypothetical protein